MEVLKTVLLVWILCSVRGHQETGFEEQVEWLLRYVRLPVERLRTVPHLLHDLERVLQLKWPGSMVMPFGSIIAGLGIRGSDVDCYVMLPNRSQVHDLTIFEAKRVLDRLPDLFHQPTAVTVAIVPHVRFIHAPTGHQCDVSFRSQAAFRNTQLIQYLLHLDKRALDLTTVIKYWSKVHKPPRERRIMSNYSMISLVIFYLQQIKVLPSVAVLQAGVQNVVVDHWETGFKRISYRSSNNDTLFGLLRGFFKYYDQFRFDDSVVSVFTGTVLNRGMFEGVDAVPDIFALYKRNVAANISEPLNTKTAICVQDAFNHASNLASTTSEEVFLKFKADLKFSAKVFSESRDDYLKAILNETEDLNEFGLESNWTNSTSAFCLKSFL